MIHQQIRLPGVGEGTGTSTEGDGGSLNRQYFRASLYLAIIIERLTR